MLKHNRRLRLLLVANARRAQEPATMDNKSSTNFPVALVLPPTLFAAAYPAAGRLPSCFESFGAPVRVSPAWQVSEADAGCPRAFVQNRKRRDASLERLDRQYPTQS